MTEDGIGTRCKCPDPENACYNSDPVPVCGSDDKTYRSECHMKIESCKKRVNLMAIHKDACKPKTKIGIFYYLKFSLFIYFTIRLKYEIVIIKKYKI